jgi:hypothetical protein
MAIQYTLTCIVVTDDNNPDREPLTLPLDTPPVEVSSAISLYLDAPPEPDFTKFGIWLLTNPSISSEYDFAFQGNKLVAGTLQPAVLEAVKGDPSHLRAVILLLLRQDLLSKETLEQIIAKARECNLPEELIVALGGG